jgi:hypothetical protein
MATLKEALKIAQQEPNSERSKALKKAILSGTMDAQATQEGVDLSKFKSHFGATTSKPDTVTTPKTQTEASSTPATGVSDLMKQPTDMSVPKPIGTSQPEMPTGPFVSDPSTPKTVSAESVGMAPSPEAVKQQSTAELMGRETAEEKYGEMTSVKQADEEMNLIERFKNEFNKTKVEKDRIQNLVDTGQITAQEALGMMQKQDLGTVLSSIINVPLEQVSREIAGKDVFAEGAAEGMELAKEADPYIADFAGFFGAENVYQKGKDFVGGKVEDFMEKYNSDPVFRAKASANMKLMEGVVSAAEMAGVGKLVKGVGTGVTKKVLKEGAKDFMGEATQSLTGGRTFGKIGQDWKETFKNVIGEAKTFSPKIGEALESSFEFLGNIKDVNKYNKSAQSLAKLSQSALRKGVDDVDLNTILKATPKEKTAFSEMLGQAAKHLNDTTELAPTQYAAKKVDDFLEGLTTKSDEVKQGLVSQKGLLKGKNINTQGMEKELDDILESLNVKKTLKGLNFDVSEADTSGTLKKQLNKLNDILRKNELDARDAEGITGQIDAVKGILQQEGFKSSQTNTALKNLKTMLNKRIGQASKDFGELNKESAQLLSAIETFKSKVMKKAGKTEVFDANALIKGLQKGDTATKKALSEMQSIAKKYDIPGIENIEAYARMSKITEKLMKKSKNVPLTLGETLSEPVGKAQVEQIKSVLSKTFDTKDITPEKKLGIINDIMAKMETTNIGSKGLNEVLKKIAKKKRRIVVNLALSYMIGSQLIEETTGINLPM